MPHTHLNLYVGRLFCIQQQQSMATRSILSPCAPRSRGPWYKEQKGNVYNLKSIRMHTVFFLVTTEIVKTHRQRSILCAWEQNRIVSHGHAYEDEGAPELNALFIPIEWQIVCWVPLLILLSPYLPLTLPALCANIAHSPADLCHKLSNWNGMIVKLHKNNKQSI